MIALSRIRIPREIQAPNPARGGSAGCRPPRQSQRRDREETPVPAKSMASASPPTFQRNHQECKSECMSQDIPLTKGYSAIVDDDDFQRVMAYKWHADVCVHTVYAVCTQRKIIGQLALKLHRLILAPLPRHVLVDHKDGNGLNCRKNNLRLSNPAGNSRNRRATRLINGIPIKGVHQVPYGRFVARIRVDGKKKHLGYFSNEIDAAIAYDKAALFHYGAFASLNFPNLGEADVD